MAANCAINSSKSRRPE